MIDGFIQNLVVKAKARTGVSEELVLWAFMVAILWVIAIVFLSVAAYSWLAAHYGGAVAGSVVGCFHALAATAALAHCISLRRRNKALAHAEVKAAAKQQAWWADPGVLAVGVEVAKIIGWRKLTPFVAAGILAATLSGERSEHKQRAVDNGAH